MSARYLSIDLARLARLRPPKALEEVAYEQLFDECIGKLQELWPEYNTGGLESDPGAKFMQVLAWRETRLREIANDKYKATRLAFASGTDLDTLAGELGVLRKLVDIGDPFANPPVPQRWEDDETLRYRCQLAWEAQSVAGPAGAYVFHAMTASADVKDVDVFGPESGFVTPGEVLVTVLSHGGVGVPANATLDAVCVSLDAYEVQYAGAPAPVVRPVRNRQGARPLTDKVIVEAAASDDYVIDLTLWVVDAADRDMVEEEALKALTRFSSQRHRLGRKILLDAIAAAAYVGDDNGESPVEELTIDSPSADINPGRRGAARASAIVIDVKVLP